MTHRFWRTLPLVGFISIFVAVLASCAPNEPLPMKSISGFEVKRYLGQWHQIAAIPAWFQSDCVANTTAHYESVGSDLLKVTNGCDRSDGSRDEAEARARFVSDPGEGKLEVTFVRVLGKWLWFAGGDYWILGLDKDYQWSVVGSPSRKFAWVLARNPTMDASTLGEIAKILEGEGYDPCALVMTMPGESGLLCDVAR